MFTPEVYSIEVMYLLTLIQNNCFFRELCWMNSKGDAVQTPMPLLLKMENLLEAARKQRQLHLENLQRSRKKNVEDATYQIEEDDMRAIYNRWRWDAESWMNPQTLMKYKHLLDSGKNAAAQQLSKSAFST